MPLYAMLTIASNYIIPGHVAATKFGNETNYQMPNCHIAIKQPLPFSDITLALTQDQRHQTNC